MGGQAEGASVEVVGDGGEVEEGAAGREGEVVGVGGDYYVSFAPLAFLSGLVGLGYGD